MNLHKLFSRTPKVAPCGIPGLVIYDSNGRGLRLPNGARVEVRDGCLFVNSQPPENFGHMDGWQCRIMPQQLDRVHDVLPGCEWEVATTDGRQSRSRGIDSDFRPFSEGANWATLAAHDGLGMPASVAPDDRVEVELPNGDHVFCRAEFVRWHWMVDYTPGDNFGRHVSDDVIAWRKLSA